MAAQTDIPFDDPPDFGYARAERMAELLEARRIKSRRAWGYGSSAAPLRVINADGSPVTFGGVPVVWSYHVAPTVPVRQADGTCRDMDIDPFLMDCPMTITQWEGIMGGAAASATTGPEVYYRSPSARAFRENDTGVGNADEAFAQHRISRGSP